MILTKIDKNTQPRLFEQLSFDLRPSERPRFGRRIIKRYGKALKIILEAFRVRRGTVLDRRVNYLFDANSPLMSRAGDRFPRLKSFFSVASLYQNDRALVLGHGVALGLINRSSIDSRA